MNGNINKQIATLFSILLFAIAAHAQVAIHGTIRAAGKAVGGVRIELRGDGDNKMLAYTFSDGQGKYRLQTVQSGSFSLLFTALSFKPVSLPIMAVEADTLVDVQLSAGGVERLQEVIVHSKRPYRLGKDTIELAVKSFLQGDERTVEDLLKKIPGIQVGTDGSIKIGDKEVQKVMVEGDDFFEKGYRLLTQSMSVRPLKKIQILQRYSHNKQLKGIENSDKIALNLELEEDSKAQWMASLDAQIVPIGPKYYQANANLMNFGKKNKYYLLGAANNNGFDAVSSINYLIQSGSPDEPGQIGMGITAPTLIDNTPNLPGFDYKRTNFNNDKLLSLNTILNPTAQLKIKLLGFANSTKKTFYRNTVQNYRVQNNQFTNTEDHQFKRKIDNYFTKVDLQFEPNKHAIFTYTGSLGSLGKNDIGTLVFNGVQSEERTKSNGYVTNQNISYSHKFSNRDVLVSSLRWIKQQTPIDYNINKFYYEDLFGVKDIYAVQQHIANNLMYIGATTHYVSRRSNGDFFQLAFNMDYQQQQLNTELKLLSNPTGLGDSVSSPSGFSNAMDFNVFQTNINTKYTFKRGLWELTPRLEVGMVQNILIDFGKSKSKNNVVLSPGLSGKWGLHEKGRLEADFYFQQQNATSTQLVPNYYTTGVRNFIRGMDNLAALSSSGASLTYTYGSLTDRFFANFSAGHQILFDYVGISSRLDPNFSLVQQVLLKDKKSSYFKGDFNYYLRAVHGNFRLDLGMNATDYANLVEGVGSRRIRAASYDYGLSFRSAWNSKLNIYMGYTLQHVNYRTEGKLILNNSRGFLNVFFSMSKNIHCNLKNESYRFGSLIGQKSKIYHFSDFTLSYEMRKHRTRFNIIAKNIFNTQFFRNVELTDLYNSSTEYRLLPRYISFGLDISF
ncbi:TonB-dependent receptor [Sphingobacterium sp. UBA5996]|uniref:TonB-dependent receptor n=1 Tax=Sphingobacterium sp. UBA5996 TaxID=1947505 RepID=UPI0025E5552C|nr:TonB-dependent receptor [Sphingobacterium sp. UBA5996]